MGVATRGPNRRSCAIAVPQQCSATCPVAGAGHHGNRELRDMIRRNISNECKRSLLHIIQVIPPKKRQPPDGHTSEHPARVPQIPTTGATVSTSLRRRTSRRLQLRRRLEPLNNSPNSQPHHHDRLQPKKTQPERIQELVVVPVPRDPILQGAVHGLHEEERLQDVEGVPIRPITL